MLPIVVTASEKRQGEACRQQGSGFQESEKVTGRFAPAM
jgi:hypothetical protein